MRKILLFFFLYLCSICCHAQNTVEEMNNIKISGSYFTGEATAATEDEARKFALSSLLEVLANYCEEMERPVVDENSVSYKMKSMKMQRGDKTLVLLYVTKDIVDSKNPVASTQASSPSASQMNTDQERPAIVYHPNTTNSSGTATTHVGGTPAIINRIGELESFSGLMAVLDQAKNNGSIQEYGKGRDMSDIDNCYIVMVNHDNNIIGILSPKHNGMRTNIKDGSEMTSDNMRTSFVNCAPICVRTK